MGWARADAGVGVGEEGRRSIPNLALERVRRSVRGSRQADQGCSECLTALG